MNVLLYETPGHKDKWLKSILLMPIGIIIVAGLFTFNDDKLAAISMLGVAAFVALAMFLILPRKYCIFDDSIKIIFGGPFSFSIPFKTVTTAKIPKGTPLTLNFPSSLSSKHAVQIVRKKRMSVIITPDNRDDFIEHLDKALKQWLQYGTGV